jgi:hypothetical protein
MNFDWNAISSWITHLDWGNVPGWFSGIATTLAVSLALYQITTDRSRRAREERRSQAMLVSGWPEGEKEGYRKPFSVSLLTGVSVPQ